MKYLTGKSQSFLIIYTVYIILLVDVRVIDVVASLLFIVTSLFTTTTYNLRLDPAFSIETLISVAKTDCNLPTSLKIVQV